MEEPSLFQQNIFEQGTEVGEFARNLFPGGELIDEDYKDPEGALEHTSQAIKDGCTVLYEAAFLHDNILIRADIIRKLDDETWALYEVKSSTKVKAENILDLSVQQYVLQLSDLRFSQHYLVHLNSEYKLAGTVDVDDLFTVKNLNSEVAAEASTIEDYIEQIRNALNLKNEPNVTLGSVCKNPYPCEFKNHCWRDVPTNSILYLPNITQSNKKFNALIDSGIRTTADFSNHDNLTESQSITAQCFESGTDYIDHESIQKHLEQLNYPLHFLDFEGVGFAIPRHQEHRPYRQFPFQYSLHVQMEENADYLHFGYLHQINDDPSKNLLDNLIQHIHPDGSIIAYHKSYEAQMFKYLIDKFPSHRDQLQSMIDRLWDLEIPFQKRWYCKKELKGRSSIKVVLPAVAPELTYENLEIQSGDMALTQYMHMVEETLPHKKQE